MWNLIVDFSKANLISSVAPYNIRDRHSIQPKRTTSVHSIASPLWKYRNSFERPRLVVRGGLVGDLNERLLILSDARSHVRARTHSHVPAIRRSILWFNQSNETRVHFGTGDPLLCFCHNWKQYQRRAWHPVNGSGSRARVISWSRGEVIIRLLFGNYELLLVLQSFSGQ